MPDRPEGAPAEAPRLWWRTLLGLCAGLGSAGGVLLYVGRSHDLSAEVHFQDGRPLVFAAAGALVLLALQALRWWLVMRPVVHLKYGRAYRAMAVGFMFNTLLPARGGDLLRVQYLGKRTGVSRAKILGTELVDFWSDKVGLVLAFPPICLLGHPPGWLFHALLLVGGLVVVVGAVLAILATRLWRGGPEGNRGPRWLANLRDGLGVNPWKRLLVVELLVAPLPWLWETLVIAVACHALGMDLTLVQAFSVLTAFNVATALPSPGNAGSFEAGGTLALVAFGVPQGTALAFVFVYHLTQVLPSFALGVLVLISEGEKLFGRESLFRLSPGKLAQGVAQGVAGEPPAAR